MSASRVNACPLNKLEHYPAEKSGIAGGARNDCAFLDKFTFRFFGPDDGFSAGLLAEVLLHKGRILAIARQVIAKIQALALDEFLVEKFGLVMGVQKILALCC